MTDLSLLTESCLCVLLLLPFNTSTSTLLTSRSVPSFQTNLLRLLGAVKQKKAARHFVTRPTQVVLPLSPNHGLFGNDGLYSESKISLETLFQRWASESWGEYLCLAGAVIG
jgi:3-oxoacyl-ACP reductase-like protein